MSFLSLPLSLKLPFSNHRGKSNRLGYLSNSGGYFCLCLMEQTQREAGAMAPLPPQRHLLRHLDTRLLLLLELGNVIFGHQTRRPS